MALLDQKSFLVALRRLSKQKGGKVWGEGDVFHLLCPFVIFLLTMLILEYEKSILFDLYARHIEEILKKVVC